MTAGHADTRHSVRGSIMRVIGRGTAVRAHPIPACPSVARNELEVIKNTCDNEY